ncbi:MAG: IS1595 family transposase [Gemmatimonadaceae bacterium]
MSSKIIAVRRLARADWCGRRGRGRSVGGRGGGLAGAIAFCSQEVWGAIGSTENDWMRGSRTDLPICGMPACGLGDPSRTTAGEGGIIDAIRRASRRAAPAGAALAPMPGLAALRRARWPGGITCPRCGSSAVHRWCRSRTGRQRYRCRIGCGRTFSDLTATPLAYTKRFDRWAEVARCMVSGCSVRQTAWQAGIAASTAFRWRHRLLAAVHRDVVRIRLTGIVEAHVGHFPESFKGRTPPRRPPRRRGLSLQGRLVRSDQVTAAFTRDRAGGWADVTLGVPGALTSDWLERALGARFALPVVLCSQTHLGFLSFCRRAGLRHHCTTAPRSRTVQGASLYDLDRVAQAARHYRWWLMRFHGVATRYLQHYLTWHGFLVANAERAPRTLEHLLLTTACRAPEP